MGMLITEVVLVDEIILVGAFSAPYLKCCALDMVKLRLE